MWESAGSRVDHKRLNSRVVAALDCLKVNKARAASASHPHLWCDLLQSPTAK